MKSFKKVIQIIRLLCFIVLATVGIGLSGGIPTPLSRKKESHQPIQIELVEDINDEKDSELDQE